MLQGKIKNATRLFCLPRNPFDNQHFCVNGRCLIFFGNFVTSYSILWSDLRCNPRFAPMWARYRLHRDSKMDVCYKFWYGFCNKILHHGFISFLLIAGWSRLRAPGNILPLGVPIVRGLSQSLDYSFLRFHLHLYPRLWDAISVA